VGKIKAYWNGLGWKERIAFASLAGVTAFSLLSLMVINWPQSCKTAEEDWHKASELARNNPTPLLRDESLEAFLQYSRACKK
jgi:hypothetical protein